MLARSCTTSTTELQDKARNDALHFAVITLELEQLKKRDLSLCTAAQG
jgi:hypothetical protein